MANTGSLFGEGGLGINFSDIISGLGNVATGIVVFLIIGVVVAILTYFITRKRAYNKVIDIFEEVNQVPIPTGTDLAREISLPNTFTRAYLLKSRKVYLARPTIQTGKGHYWFFIRKDGEWVNVGLENFNEKMKRLDVHHDHTDMRMPNAALKKLIENNYKKTNWLKEYAPYIAIGILIIMLGITFFLLLNKASGVGGQFSGVASQLDGTVQSLNQILDSLDNIKTGSGVKIVT